MFVLKDFVRDCFVAQIFAELNVRARRKSRISLSARRSNPEQNPCVRCVRTLEVSQKHAYQFLAQTVKTESEARYRQIPDNRVHELTDSNVSPSALAGPWLRFPDRHQFPPPAQCARARGASGL